MYQKRESQYAAAYHSAALCEKCSTESECAGREKRQEVKRSTESEHFVLRHAGRWRHSSWHKQSYLVTFGANTADADKEPACDLTGPAPSESGKEHVPCCAQTLSDW